MMTIISSVVSIDKRIDFLTQTPWANGMSHSEVQTLSSYMKVLQALKGEVILKEGGSESFMCIIVEGKVQVVKENTKNNPKVIATLNEGKSFGEMSIFDGEPRSAAVIAASDALLLTLTKGSLDRMLHEKPLIGVKLLFKLGRVLSQRLRLMDGKVVDYL
ncbi:Cyclic AMP receptor-like protein [Gammaproteobacteria bacterium]